MENSCNHPLWVVISDIKDLMCRFESFKVVHVHHKANMVADSLAKLGNRERSDAEVLVSVPHPELESLLEAGRVGKIHQQSQGFVLFSSLIFLFQKKKKKVYQWKQYS
ncbi:hypothetical protein LINPERHAP1_LOCUS36586 [Linum perenne]